jgi:hypothetical protein
MVIFHSYVSLSSEIMQSYTSHSIFFPTKIPHEVEGGLSGMSGNDGEQLGFWVLGTWTSFLVQPIIEKNVKKIS